jgi:hypothetical protein
VRWRLTAGPHLSASRVSEEGLTGRREAKGRWAGDGPRGCNVIRCKVQGGSRDLAGSGLARTGFEVFSIKLNL